MVTYEVELETDDWSAPDVTDTLKEYEFDRYDCGSDRIEAYKTWHDGSLSVRSDGEYLHITVDGIDLDDFDIAALEHIAEGEEVAYDIEKLVDDNDFEVPDVFYEGWLKDDDGWHYCQPGSK